MGRLFESHEALNKSWEDRALEQASMRSWFLSFGFSLFALGIFAALLVIQLVAHRGFYWIGLLNGVFMAFFAYRCGRLIYKNLR